MAHRSAHGGQVATAAAHLEAVATFNAAWAG